MPVTHQAMCNFSWALTLAQRKLRGFRDMVAEESLLV